MTNEMWVLVSQVEGIDPDYRFLDVQDVEGRSYTFEWINFPDNLLGIGPFCHPAEIERLREAGRLLWPLFEGRYGSLLDDPRVGDDFLAGVVWLGDSQHKYTVGQLRQARAALKREVGDEAND